MQFEEWEGFIEGDWKKQINVRSFIQLNYKPYDGDSSFLVESTPKTKKLWDKVLNLYEK